MSCTFKLFIVLCLAARASNYNPETSTIPSPGKVDPPLVVAALSSITRCIVAINWFEYALDMVALEILPRLHGRT